MTLLSWTPEDLIFRELIFFILCLAAGGEYHSIIDSRRVLHPMWINSYGAIAYGGGSENKRELVSSLGAEFHLDGQDMGSVPSTSRYWFAGALIWLVPCLKEADEVTSAIADAVRYGRETCGGISFNVVLISMGDLLFLRSFPDGRVEHFDSLLLLSTVGSSGMDAEHRYGKTWLDSFYESEMARRREEEKRIAAEEKARRERCRGLGLSIDQSPSKKGSSCTIGSTGG